VEEPAMPKLPHAVTHTACKGFFLPFSKPKSCLPNRLFNIVQVLAKVSFVCAVRISSQSFARAEEYEIAVMGDSFSNVDAFFARDPYEGVHFENMFR
jgi:hypothetical protein